MAIEVVTYGAGNRRIDSAEADTPAEAVAAARTLIQDASAGGAVRATASFYRDGRLVRHAVRLSELDQYAVEVAA